MPFISECITIVNYSSAEKRFGRPPRFALSTSMAGPQLDVERHLAWDTLPGNLWIPGTETWQTPFPSTGLEWGNCTCLQSRGRLPSLQQNKHQQRLPTISSNLYCIMVNFIEIDKQFLKKWLNKNCHLSLCFDSLIWFSVIGESFDGNRLVCHIYSTLPHYLLTVRILHKVLCHEKLGIRITDHTAKLKKQK